MHVFLPVLDADLADLAAGSLPAPRRGHAVTAVLAAQFPGVEGEELDYHVLAVSADDAYDLLRASRQQHRRRAVVVADLAEGDLRAGTASSEVEVLTPVPRERVVALYVDETGPPDDLLPDQELLWYAPQELDDLLGG